MKQWKKWALPRQAFVGGGLVLALGSVAFFAQSSFSDLSLDWRSELTPDLCEEAVGRPIVNVRQKVANDIDSGIAGNYWAYDYYTRNIQVWATNDPNTFCATVQYNGRFEAIPGETSPGATATLSGGEKGRMSGGYRATITGTFAPTWKTRGNLGTFDYGCAPSGTCTGRIDWVGKYFTDGSSHLDWWGWIYQGRKYGTWINAVGGNEGDITPSVREKKEQEYGDNDGEDDEHKGKKHDSAKPLEP